MSRRITPADVDVLLDGSEDDMHDVHAAVQGLRQKYYVDFNTDWGTRWWCSCGRATEDDECVHIRVTREAVKL